MTIREESLDKVQLDDDNDGPGWDTERTTLDLSQRSRRSRRRERGQVC